MSCRRPAVDWRPTSAALQRAIANNEYKRNVELQPDQCYILHNKSRFTDQSFSIVHYINIKNYDELHYTIKWQLVDDAWINPDAPEQTVDLNLVNAISTAPAFAHFYDLSLIDQQGGSRRTRIRSRSRKTRKTRNQKTRRNHRHSKRA